MFLGFLQRSQYFEHICRNAQNQGRNRAKYKSYYRLVKTAWTPYLRRLGFSRFPFRWALRLWLNMCRMPRRMATIVPVVHRRVRQRTTPRPLPVTIPIRIRMEVCSPWTWELHPPRGPGETSRCRETILPLNFGCTRKGSHGNTAF